jgi:hypothetical protein
MKRLQHITSVSLILALLVALPLHSDSSQRMRAKEEAVAKVKQDPKEKARIDQAIAQIKQEQINFIKKTAMQIAKGVLVGGLMILVSQFPGVKYSGFEVGFIIGSVPAGIGVAVDDPETKEKCFSAAASIVAFAGVCGFFGKPEVVKPKQNATESMMKRTTDLVKCIRLNNLPFTPAVAGTFGGLSAASVYLGEKPLKAVGRFLAGKNILLEYSIEQYLSNKDKDQEKDKEEEKKVSSSSAKKK